jgi:acetaldehyde dehydrogenase/alcohol dehydrogenase
MNWFGLPKKVYYKRGSMPVALKELAEVYKLKTVFIVSDSKLWTSGIVEPVDELLADFGLRTAEYFTVEEKPTLANVLAGKQKIEEFEPEAIVAVGGPNVMSVAKALWILYENPDADLVTLSTKFNNSTKDTQNFPKVGKKAKFATVSTGVGASGANTPFILLKGDGRNLTIASFNLLPEIASIDANFFFNMPEGTIKDTALKTVTLAVEAFVSPDLSDYSAGFAKDAVKAVLNNLENAVKNNNPVAFEHIAHAASIAEIAYGNTIETVSDEIKPFSAEIEAKVKGAKYDELLAYCGVSGSLADALAKLA